MRKTLYILSLLFILSIAAPACSTTSSDEASESYKQFVKRYYEADSRQNKEAVEDQARTSLTADDFERFHREVHPDMYIDKRTHYDPAERDAVEAYVAEHNRLCARYHNAADGSALKDSLYREMENLEMQMHSQRSRGAYEAFLVLRDSI